MVVAVVGDLLYRSLAGRGGRPWEKGMRFQWKAARGELGNVVDYYGNGRCVNN